MTSVTISMNSCALPWRGAAGKVRRADKSVLYHGCFCCARVSACLIPYKLYLKQTTRRASRFSSSSICCCCLLFRARLDAMIDDAACVRRGTALTRQPPRGCVSSPHSAWGCSGIRSSREAMLCDYHGMAWDRTLLPTDRTHSTTQRRCFPDAVVGRWGPATSQELSTSGKAP